ncbi:MAG: sporulation protein YqfD [Senegalia sp. (in: firmicutes)]|uniref:sporulation protein YqfD n=1 Tax=Senegalia sp. (in: firmicutes) TaxID=1924098 RepID=UPI003F98CA8D
MLIVRLWNYISGYVIIRIEGLTLERFINLSTINNIYLWDIERLDYTTIQAKVSLKGFKELKPIILKVGSRYNILSREGLPFFLTKLRKRKMLALGFILMIGVIFFLTSFIWNIDISSPKGFNQEELVEYLNEKGVKIGVRKSFVDNEELKIEILKEFDDIAYINLKITGTKLIVNLKEREFYSNDDKWDKNKPANIISSKKGVVQKVIAKNGNPLVEKGDIVKKGQVLITGVLKNEEEENILLVHSEGEILAKTYYYKTIKEPIIKKVKEETGEKYFSREIKIGEKSIHIKNDDIPFKNYIEHVDDKSNEFYSIIPFDIIKHEYREVRIKEVKQNIDSLKEALSVIITKEAMKEVKEDMKVESKEITFEKKDNFLITSIKLEMIENIAEKEYINENIEIQNDDSNDDLKENEEE